MIEQGCGILEQELNQPPLRRPRRRDAQRLAADETAGFVPIAGKGKARLQRIIGGPDVVRPVAIGLLDAQRVERVIAAVTQAVRRAGLDKRVVDRQRERGRDVQLPAELADEGQAQRQAL